MELNEYMEWEIKEEYLDDIEEPPVDENLIIDGEENFI